MIQWNQHNSCLDACVITLLTNKRKTTFTCKFSSLFCLFIDTIDENPTSSASSQVFSRTKQSSNSNATISSLAAFPNTHRLTTDNPIKSDSSKSERTRCLTYFDLFIRNRYSSTICSIVWFNTSDAKPNEFSWHRYRSTSCILSTAIEYAIDNPVGR